MSKVTRNATIWSIATLLLIVLVAGFMSEADCRVAVNTLLLGVLVSVIAIPLGAITAWAASGRGFISRTLLIVLIGLLFVPLFLHVPAWDAAIGKLGWFTTVRGEVVKAFLDGWPAAVWVHAVAATPQVAVIFLLGSLTGRRVFEDQALLETGRGSVFWHVTMPRLFPLGMLAALWTMVGCAREIAVTDLYRIGTLAEQIYLGFSLGAFNPIQGTWSVDELADAAATGGLVTVAIIGWLVVSAIWLFSGLTRIEFHSDQQQPRAPARSSAARSAISFGLLLVLAVVPLGNLFLRCGLFVEHVDDRPVMSWSLDQVFDGISRVSGENLDALTWSILIAAVSATAILAIGILFVWGARNSRVLCFLLIGAMAISCAIPGPLIGTWLSQLLSGNNGETMIWLYDRTIFAPVLATMLFCWPLSALILWFIFRTVPEDSLENARTEGAGWWNRMIRIGIAGNIGAIIGCWLITFAICLGELSASQLVLPPGMDTVPRLTLGWLHSGVDEMTAAITIVSVGGIILLSLLGWSMVWLNRHSGNRQ